MIYDKHIMYITNMFQTQSTHNHGFIWFFWALSKHLYILIEFLFQYNKGESKTFVMEILNAYPKKLLKNFPLILQLYFHRSNISPIHPWTGLTRVGLERSFQIAFSPQIHLRTSWQNTKSFLLQFTNITLLNTNIALFNIKI